MTVQRSEYPRPQWVRDDWLCLNGMWEFEIDNSDSGIERGLLGRSLSDKITVPFCPESVLSGIGNTDFMRAVWYRREIEIPGQWQGQKVLLHFQAVDYDATVWVNGTEVSRHRGGWTSFTVDITFAAKAGETAVIVVRARDDMAEAMPRGKQSAKYANHECEYTRTTGIWQSVWLEPVPQTYLKRPKITPQLSRKSFLIEQGVAGNASNMKVQVKLKDKDGLVSSQSSDIDNMNVSYLALEIPDSKLALWCPENPHLYDLEVELIDEQGNIVDTAKSYAGLREITIDGKAIKINGKTVFQRLVLDQGYYIQME